MSECPMCGESLEGRSFTPEELEAAYLRKRSHEAEKDAARLLHVKDWLDGFGDFDFHEKAAELAASKGREEPTDDDYLAVIRIAFDESMLRSRSDRKGTGE